MPEWPEDVFEIKACLGKGSYGEVYKAFYAKTGQMVACKILGSDVELGDLSKEIKMLVELTNQYIVSYIGQWKGKDGRAWIVMEYCEGGCVSDLMSICNRTLTEVQIACVMSQTLKGLAYLHKQRKIHRDIKAGNILLCATGACKLADFGVSAQLTESIDKRQTTIGTPYWMAPEVLQQGTAYDEKADIWSIGITAIEMALGDPPHSDIHPMRALFIIPKSAPPRLPEGDAWSANFQDFVANCLQKTPADRPSCVKLLEHPFIAGVSDEFEPIGTLVEEEIDQIEEYRATADQEDDEDEGGGTVVGDIADYGGTMVANGTMQYSGTTVFSGTMVAGTMDSGTMVASGTMEEIEQPGDKPQPSFMAYFNKPSEIKSDYYKNNKVANVDQNSDILTLQAALSDWRKVQIEETDHLIQFYDQRQGAISKLIALKRLEGKQANAQ